MLLPRIKLLQPLSPEVAEQGQKPGTLFLSLSNRNLGREVVVTPVLHFRSRVKWFPREDGGGIDCSSPDGRAPRETKYAQACAECPHQAWNPAAEKRKDQAPACTLYENFVVLVGSDPSPVVLPMERTKVKPAKKWYSMMALRGGDMCDWTYKVGTLQEKNAEGQPYFNFQVSDTGKPPGAEVKAKALAIWEALAKTTITTEVEHPEAEVAGSTAAPPGAIATSNRKF